jgi:hypothetical protein
MMMVMMSEKMLSRDNVSGKMSVTQWALLLMILMMVRTMRRSRMQLSRV